MRLHLKKRDAIPRDGVPLFAGYLLIITFDTSSPPDFKTTR